MKQVFFFFLFYVFAVISALRGLMDPSMEPRPAAWVQDHVGQQIFWLHAAYFFQLFQNDFILKN